MFLFKPNRKNRNTAYRRHQRNRHIQRKKNILLNIYQFEDDYFNDQALGKLDKGKVHCSCRLCKYNKHYKIPKKQELIADLNMEYGE